MTARTRTGFLCLIKHKRGDRCGGVTKADRAIRAYLAVSIKVDLSDTRQLRLETTFRT
jgi:hypothetical protein